MKGRIVQFDDLIDANLEQRISILREKFGLRKKDLKLFRYHDRESFIDATSMLYSKMKALDLDPSFIMAHITGSILSPLFSEEEDFRKATSSVSNAITYAFASDAKDLSKLHGVEINAVEALRIIVYEAVEMKNLDVNAAEAKRVWGKKVKFSASDLMRGVKLPVSIGLEEAFLLGVLTVSAHADSVEESIRGKYCFDCSNSPRTEKEFFRDIVQDLVYKTFNLPSSKNHNNHIREHVVQINSKAVYTFLCDVLKMNPSIKQRSLLNLKNMSKDISNNDLKKSYLYGILAKKMKLVYDRTCLIGQMKFNHNPSLLQQIGELSESLGYNPSFNLDAARLIFYGRDITSMIGDNLFQKNNFPYPTLGSFVNPYHIGKLRK